MVEWKLQLCWEQLNVERRKMWAIGQDKIRFSLYIAKNTTFTSFAFAAVAS